VPGVGANPLGGLVFADSSQLVIVGGSDSPQGVAYNYVPIRDPGTGRITGLSPSGVVGPTPNAHSGLEVYSGLLFYSRYGDNKVAEYNPVTDPTWLLPLPSYVSSTGGLTFVPAGSPNAVNLLVSPH